MVSELSLALFVLFHHSAAFIVERNRQIVNIILRKVMN